VGPDLGSSLFVSSTTGILILKKKAPKRNFFKLMQTEFSWWPFCIPAYNGFTMKDSHQYSAMFPINCCKIRQFALIISPTKGNSMKHYHANLIKLYKDLKRHCIVKLGSDDLACSWVHVNSFTAKLESVI